MKEWRGRDPYLVTNASTGRVKVNTLALGKVLNLLVFRKVGFGSVRDVVVQRHDDLAGVLDARRANREKLGRNRPCAKFAIRLPTHVVDEDEVLTCHGSCTCAGAG